MGTVYDYLDWRGDLTFTEAPVNEVDSLIFSLLSYVDFCGILPEKHEETAVPLKAAANAFFARNPDLKKYSIGLIVPKSILKLLRAVKDTRRFRNIEMKAHINQIDTEREMQFSATTFLLPGNTAFVAFRGTDDTIIGWKENFNMSYLPVVPAQEEAANYLNRAADHFTGNLYVTGHSKGGNLAVYATVHCREDVQQRILQSWSNDGPGFGTDILNDTAFIKMRPVIKTLVPQSSVVGMLLEHDENYTVVKSRQSGLLQHDGLSWDVMGNSFIHLQNITDESKRVDKTLHEWIHQMTPEQRETFTGALYQLLSSDNAMTLTDLLSAKNRWIMKSKDLDPHVHKTISQTLNELINLNTKSLFDGIFPKNSK